MYFFGWIVLYNIWCLKFVFFLSLIWIVLDLESVFGKDLIVVFIFDGIFIIFFFKFCCFFFGFFIICINGIFGVMSFFFIFVIFNFVGFLGNLNLFMVV